MKLYQDYKNEMEQKKQLEEDKDMIGLGEEVVIIYEKKSSPLREIGGVLLFFMILAALGVVIVGVLKFLS